MATRLTPSKGQNTQRRSRSAAKSPKTRKLTRVVGSKHPVTKDPRSEFSEDEWHDMVATAAFYRAEARGFPDGSADEDWYEAEAELRERLASVEETPEIEDGPVSDESISMRIDD